MAGPVVDVYRNLNQPGVCYSVRSTGRRPRVLSREETVLLAGPVRFIVQPGGQSRAQREQRRNVHAWVRGALLPLGALPSLGHDLPWRHASYSPFRDGGFRDRETGEEVTDADAALLSADGLAYLPCGLGPGGVEDLRASCPTAFGGRPDLG